MPHSSELTKILSSKGIKTESNLIESLNFENAELPNWKFCTDSRSITKDSWFIALKGPNFNGHQFLNKAIESGAKGIVVSEKNEVWPNNIPILFVEDTLDAYQSIARHQRRKLNPVVIGITGSNGKTTTKEILFNVLSQKFDCLASNANENNEIGVPKNLLRIEKNTEVFIQEMGMRGLGQIEELTKIAEPDYSVITNIGTAHIGILGSREKIAQAKAEIFVHQPKGKDAIIPRGEPLLKTWQKQNEDKIDFIEFGNYESIEFKNGALHFEYRGNSFKIKSSNIAFVKNCCAVIDLAFELDLTAKEIQKGLNEFEPQEGRGKLIELPSGATLIDESYNSNPDSALALAQSMKLLSNGQNKRKILILGEMAELDGKEKELLGNLNKNLENLIDEVLWINVVLPLKENDLGAWGVHFPNKEAALEHINKNKEQYLNENCLIGIKGSRVAKMEKIIDSLTNT